MIEFQFEMENESLEGLYLNWDSASAGTHGEIPLEVEYNSESDSGGLLLLVLVIIIFSVFLIINNVRVEG